MQITFKNKKVEKSLTEDNEILKSYGKNAKKIKQRMNQIKSSVNLIDILKIPQLRLHPLKGPRKNQWTIDIQDNWRICFEVDLIPIPLLEDGGVNLSAVTKIKIIEVFDPH